MRSFRRIAMHQALMNCSDGVTAGQYALTGFYNGPFIQPNLLLSGPYDYEYEIYPETGASEGFVLPYASENTVDFNPADSATGLFISHYGAAYHISWGSLVTTTTSPTYNEWQAWGKAGTTFSVKAGATTRVSQVCATNPSAQSLAAIIGGRSSLDKGNQTIYFKGKWKSLKVWSDSSRAALLRNMWVVPAGLKAAGAGSNAIANGMWDSVTSQYYYNVGSGSFGTEAL